jgi:aminoglycoside 6-adenylyltransferase
LKNGFSHNSGKFSKYFEPELWDLLRKTYLDAGCDSTWKALLTLCELFRRVARTLTEHFNFDYPYAEDRRVTAYLERVRSLPKDAVDM